MSRLALVLVASIMALAWPAASSAQLPSFRTDHFKCYPVQRPETVNEFVSLRDQFDADFPNSTRDEALVGAHTLFCNPTTKTDVGGAVTPIVNPNNHLALYRISTASLQAPGLTALVPPGTWTVEARNQFGTQSLRLGPPVLLATPTQKRPHEAPSGLDHFKCYLARGAASDPARQVTLQDQFDPTAESARILRPLLFCNPTQKRHDEQVIEIQNPTEHLLCYAYAGTAVPSGRRTVSIRNQFGPQQFLVRQPRVLCVPTLKEGFVFVPALP
jgi:hypothetical protein